jgi:hypothetical protein
LIDSPKVVKRNTKALCSEVEAMAKNSHPGKREALKEYKVAYLAYLQQEISYAEFLALRKKFLDNPELGIDVKTLDRAETEALNDRKKQLQHQ